MMLLLQSIIIVGVQMLWLFVQVTNCLPIQRKSNVENSLLPPLTALATFADGKTFVVSILKPTHLSQFNGIRRKLEKFRTTTTPTATAPTPTTHEATINTVFPRQFKANKNDNKILRLCLKQLKLAKWRRQHSRYGILLCSIQFPEFGPIEYVIPIDIKSMDDDTANVHENDKQANKIQKSDEKTTFDGPENSYTRQHSYQSQVAIGDPIRSKRKKRIRRTISYRMKNSITLLNNKSYWQ